jgi:hypothetical protein
MLARVDINGTRYSQRSRAVCRHNSYPSLLGHDMCLKRGPGLAQLTRADGRAVGHVQERAMEHVRYR